MASNGATEPAFDLRHIRDVIEVSMREEQKLHIDTAPFQPLARPVGRIKENPSVGSLDQVGVGFENAAAEGLVNHRGCFDLAPKLTWKARFVFPALGMKAAFGGLNFCAFLNVNAWRLSQLLYTYRLSVILRLESNSAKL